jgi:hypothetical protein
VRLARVFPDAEVVVALRNQVDLLTSLYSSWLKLGGTDRIEQFLWRPGSGFDERERSARLPWPVERARFNYDHFTLNLSNFEYVPLIDLYERLFPRVHVLLYETFESDLDVATRVFERLLDDVVDASGAPPVDRVNPRLADRDLHQLRRRNAVRSIFERPRTASYLTKAFRLTEPLRRGLPVRESVRRFVGDYYTESNDALFARLPSAAPWRRRYG